jgi:hypothetical protein
MMKRSSLTLFTLLIVTVGYAQVHLPCTSPMPQLQFQQKMFVLSKARSEDQKLQIAHTIASGNCLSSAQVKQIAEQFVDEDYRLDFAEMAFENTVDQNNFYTVYDAFANFSTVFMLHDYVTGHCQITPVIPQPPVGITFQDYEYPSAYNYHGPTNCNIPMPDQDFMSLAVQLANQKYEPGRMLIATQMVQNNCISVEQVMKMASLLQMESNRLSFAKAAYAGTYDIKNYHFIDQLFTYAPYKADLKQFIMSQSVIPVPPPPPCFVSETDFTDICASIRKQNFNATRVTIARQVIQAKGCFTSRQVFDLVKLFDFEDSRLEVAKFAFAYTTDKENYYIVNDALSFESSKSELSKFISGH